MEQMHENPIYREGEPDRDMSGFIDGFDLSERDKHFLKTEVLKYPVHEEVNEIWHYLETQGEDHRGNATKMIKDLVRRLRL
jgi:hypothetical protein